MRENIQTLVFAAVLSHSNIYLSHEGVIWGLWVEGRSLSQSALPKRTPPLARATVRGIQKHSHQFYFIYSLNLV